MILCFRPIRDNVDGASCSKFCVLILELEAPTTYAGGDASVPREVTLLTAFSFVEIHVSLNSNACSLQKLCSISLVLIPCSSGRSPNF